MISVSAVALIVFWIVALLFASLIAARWSPRPLVALPLLVARYTRSAEPGTAQARRLEPRHG